MNCVHVILIATELYTKWFDCS